LQLLLSDPLIAAKIRLQASDALGTKNPNRVSRNQEEFLSQMLQEYYAAHPGSKPDTVKS